MSIDLLQPSTTKTAQGRRRRRRQRRNSLRRRVKMMKEELWIPARKRPVPVGGLWHFKKPLSRRRWRKLCGIVIVVIVGVILKMRMTAEKLWKDRQDFFAFASSTSFVVVVVGGMMMMMLMMSTMTVMNIANISEHFFPASAVSIQWAEWDRRREGQAQFYTQAADPEAAHHRTCRACDVLDREEVCMSVEARTVHKIKQSK